MNEQEKKPMKNILGWKFHIMHCHFDIMTDLEDQIFNPLI